ncbi:MAG: nucleotidyltransferase family protein [bacterium]
MAGRAERESGAVSVSAVVLAAGRATRMGGQKVLLPLGGRSVVQWVVDAALGSRAVETIVVLGHDAGMVNEALDGRPVTVVVNPDYARGMSTSLQAGLRAVHPGCDAAVFLLGDQPFVTSALVDQLIHRFAETRKGVVRPVVGDRPAHPVLMSAALFPEILEQRGDVGGREIARRHLGQLCLVPVDDPRLDLDIDTSKDYETALQIEGRPVERTREKR